MPKTIVAVAIGAAQLPTTITSNATIPSWARKYINGCIGAFPHTLGTDYVIDYRQCPASQLGTSVFTNALQADYIVCLSTTVLIAAAHAYPDTAANPTPIIGMCSNPQQYGFHNQTNVCGVSAGRSGDAHQGYRHLLRTVQPAFASATVLSDPTYTPSTDSVTDIHNGGDQPHIVNVSAPADVQNWINGANAGDAVLLLPVDWMFGAAPDIIGWASNCDVLDFWFVSDWVKPSPNQSAFGGYGVPQEASGVYLAQQLNSWWLGLGNPGWAHVPQNQRAWQASQTRANSAHVALNAHGPKIVP